MFSVHGVLVKDPLYEKKDFCSGSKSYIKLAEEFLEQNNQKIGSAA